MRRAILQLQMDADLLQRRIQSIRRHLEVLDSDSTEPQKPLTNAEIEHLLQFNQRLIALERYLVTFATYHEPQLVSLMADQACPLDDYEIEAMLYFTLGERDSDYDEEDDNFITTRSVRLKGLGLGANYRGFADGVDHKEPSANCFPGALQTIPHCRLFYELYSHSFGLEQPKLSFHQMLRIDSIWVDISIQYQSTLSLASGEWLPPQSF